MTYYLQYYNFLNVPHMKEQEKEYKLMGKNA